MKGIIHLVVETDYDKLFSESDLESLKRFTGAKDEFEVIKHHVEGLTRELVERVSSLEFAKYHVESNIVEDENQTNVDEANEVFNKATDWTDDEQDYSTIIADNEEDFSQTSDEDSEVSEEEMVEDFQWGWGLDKSDIKEGFKDVFNDVQDRGTIMKVVVNRTLYDTIKESLDDLGSQVEVVMEAMEDMYGIVVDLIDNEDDEFDVVMVSKDGKTYQVKSIW